MPDRARKSVREEPDLEGMGGDRGHSTNIPEHPWASCVPRHWCRSLNRLSLNCVLPSPAVYHGARDYYKRVLRAWDKRHRDSVSLQLVSVSVFPRTGPGHWLHEEQASGFPCA